MRVVVENHGPDEATLDVLPTLWFRNTWSWTEGAPRPRIERDGTSLRVDEHALAGYRLDAAPGPDGLAPESLFCENDTNLPRVFGAPPSTLHPKDGIDDHVVSGADTVQPGRPSAPRPRCATGSPSPRAARPSCGCACTVRTATGRRNRTGRGSRLRRGGHGPRGRRRRVLRGPGPGGYHDRRSSGCCARRVPGWCGASRSTPTTWVAGSTATPGSRRPQAPGAACATMP